MKRRMKAIAAAAAIIAPVAAMAAPAGAQQAPEITSVQIVGPNWQEFIYDDYTVYEDELPAGWSISAHSNAESMTWEVNGGVVLTENEQPYLISRNNPDSYDPAGYGPGTYEITATAHSEDRQRGAETSQTVTLTIEPGSRPHFDFVVNSYLDAHDTTRGDGVCGHVADGISQCTLRAAVEEANAQGGGRISLKDTQAGYQLNLGALPIKSGIGVVGLNQQPHITANDSSQVFDIWAEDEVVVLNNLDISHGKSETVGGNVKVSAGIVWILNSTIRNGHAAFGGGGVGLIHSSDVEGRLQRKALQIDNSVLTENTSERDGGAVHTSWVGPGENLQVSISSSFLTHNSALNGNGGGVSVGQNTQFTLHDSVVAENEATYGGSGVHLHISDATITQSTIADNRTGIAGTSRRGAGLFLYTVTDPGTLSIEHTVLSGNTVTTSSGTTRSDCDASNSHNFTFGPGNYVEHFGDECRWNTGSSWSPRNEAFGAPHIGKNDDGQGRISYVVDSGGPIAELGLEGRSACWSNRDIVGNRRGVFGCASGAFALSAADTDVTETESFEQIQNPSIPGSSIPGSSTPIQINPIDIGEPVDMIELPGISSVPQFDLSSLALG